MKLRHTLVTATLVTAALGISTAGASAAPVSENPVQQEVHYEVNRQGDSAVITTSDGKLQAVGDQLVLTDQAGTPVASVPLTYRMNGNAYPIAAEINGGTAVLTPAKEGGTPIADVAAADVISADTALKNVSESFTPRDQTALGVLAQRLTIGSAVSAIVGAVLGGGIGCLVGGAVGATISSPVIALLLPFVGATIAGCVLGAATLGAVGGVVGLVTVGGPLALFSAFQYFSTILTPCPATLAMCKDPATVPATK
ncbi:hypothetical protein [Nocardia huaxiensis]|uniref:DUF8020 domain-containing protein n=1 Tax=Nocardia huaxiensis TaxID=2755382 RepID=A0A7D6VFJ4_9NOCA|nr:hypothetical protein [Nocardia huaxiensis]QLY31757.1 hypothetical protein H0264_05435 [Nocardia huaxiensis]UFS95318.1 hypothetical protein LPY97_32290 [Nocardia huaxiensis]